jgi:hypothetical protein
LATSTDDLRSLPRKCFWMENTSGTYTWTEAAGAPNRNDCFRLDSCNGGKGQSGGGCYKWAATVDSPAEPWPGQGKCFWMENYSGRYQWVAAGISTRAGCRELDSCSSGGGRRSGGGCYKWASKAQDEGASWQ